MSTSAAVAVVLCAATAHAQLTRCKVKINPKDGTILVSASKAAGPLQWGDTAGTIGNSFFDPACVTAGVARDCTLGDVGTAARITPPEQCAIHLSDGTTTCSAFIKGCTPGLRGAPAAAVCGNGVGEAGEACDDLDLNGQTCQSAGFSYGALACDACALDTTGCTNARYQDNGDGTVTDHQTQLMWEKKTGTLSGVNVCPGAATCSDPHDVNNVYAWSTGAPWNPDGSAFFSFLGALNGLGSFAGHSDWRLPTADELYSIVDGMRLNPAIDPVFGPTKPSVYWSSSTYQDDPGRAWSAFFAFGATTTSNKTFSSYVRAVRSAY